MRVPEKRSEKGPPAVVLLSGGLDSTTAAWVAKREGFALHGLTFRYGQRHEREVEAARELAGGLAFESHLVLEIDPAPLAGSALTDRSVPVPKGRSLDELGSGPIPVTYVPARNTIFLAYALAACEVRGSGDIFVGMNALDYSGYPDCRPEYLQAFERLAGLATRAGVEEGRKFRIHAPLLRKTKAEIIRLGLELGIDYSRTWSCYDPTPDGRHCGLCDSCLLRRKGFREAGAVDPTRYAA